MRCVYVHACLLVLFVSLLALPVASQSESQPNENWETLDNLLTQLENEAQNLSADSEKMKALLEAAQKELTTLSAKLEESRMQGKELFTLLEKSAQSLESSVQYLEAEKQRLNLELWVWRVFAALGIVIGFLGLIK